MNRTFDYLVEPMLRDEQARKRGVTLTAFQHRTVTRWVEEDGQTAFGDHADRRASQVIAGVIRKKLGQESQAVAAPAAPRVHPKYANDVAFLRPQEAGHETRLSDKDIAKLNDLVKLLEGAGSVAGVGVQRKLPEL